MKRRQPRLFMIYIYKKLQMKLHQTFEQRSIWRRFPGERSKFVATKVQLDYTKAREALKLQRTLQSTRSNSAWIYDKLSLTTNLQTEQI